MSSAVGSNTVAPTSRYDEVRGLLFRSIFLRRGMSVFNEYWNGFKSFVLGRISKLEFDEIMTRNLTTEESELYFIATIIATCTVNINFTLMA
jgi:hypothetical protein